MRTFDLERTNALLDQILIKGYSFVRVSKNTRSHSAKPRVIATRANPAKDVAVDQCVEPALRSCLSEELGAHPIALTPRGQRPNKFGSDQSMRGHAIAPASALLAADGPELPAVPP